MLEKFVEVVNSQNKYNTADVNAVPILIWHKIDNSKEEYTTSIDLFEAEMKYLYDNGFTVLTMADLVYDDANRYLKISNGDDRVHIPNNEKGFAARINDVNEESNKPLSSEEESDISAEKAREDDTAVQDVSPTTNDYDTISKDGEGESEPTEPTSKSPQEFNDNKGEDTEGQLPSVILQFLNEP